MSLGLLLLAGCNQPQASAPVSSIPTRTLSIAIRSHPDYKRAEAAYRAGDKAQARSILAGLKKSSTSLTPQDTEFLDRQIAITEGKGGVAAPETIKPLVGAKSPTPSSDCGPRALKIAAEAMGVKSEVKALAQAGGTDKNGTSLDGMIQAARSIGLKSGGVQVDKDALIQTPTPAVAWFDGNHYVALLKISTNPVTGSSSATIHDPNEGVEKTLPIEELLSRSGGIVLTLKKG